MLSWAPFLGRCWFGIFFLLAGARFWKGKVPMINGSGKLLMFIFKIEVQAKNYQVAKQNRLGIFDFAPGARFSIDYEQSLFFCSPSSKTRDTQMATRETDGARWERLPSSFRASRGFAARARVHSPY